MLVQVRLVGIKVRGAHQASEADGLKAAPLRERQTSFSQSLGGARFTNTRTMAPDSPDSFSRPVRAYCQDRQTH